MNFTPPADIFGSVQAGPDESERRGLLVTFEGVEGSGKSTQIELLAEWLRERGERVTTAREPGTTATGELVRGFVLGTAPEDLSPEAEFALFLAARAQLAAEVLAPALAAGEVVLVDRFGDSSVAYQGYGRGLDPARIAACNAWATRGLEPDLTVLIDVPTDEGAGRRDRPPDRIERLERGFHERVRDGYLAMVGNQPGRFVVLEGNRPISALQGAIRERVAELLEGRTTRRTAIE